MRVGTTVRFSMAGTSIACQSARFKLRTLGPQDATPRYAAWIADASVMEPLNMPARRLSLDDLRRHIGEFDNQPRHLIGMFDRVGDQHFGVFLVDVLPQHRSAKLSYFIGDPDYRGIGAFRECAKALISHLFSVRGMEKLTAQVAVDNQPSIAGLESLGFKREGLMRGEILSYKQGRGRLDQFFYGLLKDDWQPKSN